MFQLTEGEKILVLAVCLGLLGVTVVITVCVVLESCWLRMCLKRIAKKRKMKYANVDGLNEGTFIKMTGTPQYTTDCRPPINMVTSPLSEISQQGKNSARKREDSTYSSMSSSSQGNASISNYSEVSAETRVIDFDQELNYGQVTFSVIYRANENGTANQLIVVLKEAQDLPPRSYGGTCDPYLVLHLFRDKSRKRWAKGNNSLLYEFRTSSKRKTQHPLFKETCVMDVSKSDLKDGVLKISAFDDEKYANDSAIGEVTVPLRDLPLQSNFGEECVMTIDFMEPRQDQGELLFGLSYLPTAERLTFNIDKAINLHPPTEDVESFAPFIRVLLMHNGKLLTKKKTSARPGTVNPVFNESLTFDVPQPQLDHVVILLVASHRDTQEGAVSSPDSPTSPPGSSSRKNRHVGKVVIGSCVRGLPLIHWNAMKQSPRKQVTQWHTLK